MKVGDRSAGVNVDDAALFEQAFELAAGALDSRLHP